MDLATVLGDQFLLLISFISFQSTTLASIDAQTRLESDQWRQRCDALKEKLQQVRMGWEWRGGVERESYVCDS